MSIDQPIVTEAVTRRCPCGDDASLDLAHNEPLTEEQLWGTYDALRDRCPAHHSTEYGGYWTLTRYDDVKAALRDFGTFSSSQGIHIPSADGVRIIPIAFDPPEHSAYRHLVMEAFRPDRVRALQPFLDDLLEELVGDFFAAGGGDFVPAVAFPLPLRVLTELVGFSRATVDHLRDATERMWDVLYETKDAFVELAMMSMAELDEHRVARPDDYITWLLDAALPDRELTDDERIRMLMAIAVAGHETTTNAASTLMHLLATHPEIQDRLRADEQYGVAVVEESLRLRPAGHTTARVATRDVEVAGTTIPAGDRVLLVQAAAGRDAARFPDPDTFDPDRDTRGNLAFGWGIHQCVGAALARAELRAMVATLRRYPPFRLAGDPDLGVLRGGTHYGPRSLTIAFDA